MVPDVVSAVVRISRIFGMNCLRLPKASMAAIKEAHSTSAMVAPERRARCGWEGEVALGRRLSCGWEGEAAPGLVELAPRASCGWEGEVAPERRESGDWEGEVALVRGVSLSVYQRKNWLGSAFTKEATSYFWASSCRRDFNTDVISKFSLNAELPADGRCGLRGGL